ncbi:hypothetical protein HDU84_008445 [Entophlyctis sp. JEL0112]|nr:hypothetical protein HDU84_008445 [Entophlyctis sp. JEL0112]
MASRITASCLPAPNTAYVAAPSDATVKVTVFAHVPAGCVDAVLSCSAVGTYASVASASVVALESVPQSSIANSSSAVGAAANAAALFFEGSVPLRAPSGAVLTAIGFEVTTSAGAFKIAGGATVTVCIGKPAASLAESVSIGGQSILHAQGHSDDGSIEWKTIRFDESDVDAASTLSFGKMSSHVFIERAQPFWLEGNSQGGAIFVKDRERDTYMSTSGNRIDDPRDIVVALVNRADGVLCVVIALPPLVMRVQDEVSLYLHRDKSLSHSEHGLSLFIAVSRGTAQDLLNFAARMVAQEFRKPQQLLSKTTTKTTTVETTSTFKKTTTKTVTLTKRIDGEPIASREFVPFPVNETTPPPQVWDHFMWCTWDAFYRYVTEEKVLAGLKEFHDLDITVDVVLIDDGWQHYTTGDEGWDQQLISFEPDKTKFPNGLNICKELKAKGVKYVGVWHTLMGTWLGIEPNGPIGQKYKLTKVTRRDGVPMFIVDPEDVSRYYEDMHEYLRQNGVDFVKIDHQASFDQLIGEDADRCWPSYQKAMIEQATKMPAVWCMSHSPNVIFDTILGKLGSGQIQTWQSTFRSSDDFYPNQPHSHNWHVYVNAMNTLLLGSFAQNHTIMDWDMFHSKHEYSFLHAAARAVSGSAVYVSDKLGEHDAKLVKAMCVAGRGLRSQQTCAWPTADSIFFDFFDKNAAGKPLFKIANSVGLGAAVVGVFNFGDPSERAPNAGWVSVRDLNGVSGDGQVYAALFGKLQTVTKVAGNESIPIVVCTGDAEVITFAPLKQTEVAGAVGVVGLLGKLNGYAAVTASDLTVDGSRVLYRTKLWAAGVVGIYVEDISKVANVLVNGESANWTQNEKVLAIDCQQDGKEVIKATVIEVSFVN